MNIPTLEGLIRRRLLVNFRVDPAVMRKLLPACFRPKLHRGHAIAGLCLIRLEQVRPAGVPQMFGLTSENAAHRVAVEWTTYEGENREGVFILRRDTNSTLGRLAGGRIFPGIHHRGEFFITDEGGRIDFTMVSRAENVSIQLRGQESDALPPGSIFASLAESSKFFENGSLGYSSLRNSAHDYRGPDNLLSGWRSAAEPQEATDKFAKSPVASCASALLRSRTRTTSCPGHVNRHQPEQFDGLRLETMRWGVRPFAVSQVESAWIAGLNRQFPGAAQFDHALLMRDVPHRWHGTERLS